MLPIDRDKLRIELNRERELHLQRNQKSCAVFNASVNLFGSVPMTWMTMWSGGYPMQLNSAFGAQITDIDGNSYVDFALGDTGAMAGHSPKPTTDAIMERIVKLGGITTMLPSEDAQWVAAELTRRFKLPKWSFTLSATDANRWALRLARMVTGKSKVLAFPYCYHGTVDETFVVVDENGNAIPRRGNVGPAIAVHNTTRVAEFNDLESVEKQLAHGDVAVLITEPALTNIGIVLPKPSFLAGLRELCTKHGTLLLIDETHTFSAGPGGCTGLWNLEPDIFVIGKSIGGGIPCGTYGLSEKFAAEVLSHKEGDIQDTGGVGGTLAGNVLSTAAMRATLSQVLTDQAFTKMIALADEFVAGVKKSLSEFQIPWIIQQLGARAEYRYTDRVPVNGNESASAHDPEIEEYMHLFMSNRGVLITPFHNMALMCPATTSADVAKHTKVFSEAVANLR